MENSIQAKFQGCQNRGYKSLILDIDSGYIWYRYPLHVNLYGQVFSK